MGAFGQRISARTSAWIAAEVDRSLVEEKAQRRYPPRALDSERAIFVELTTAAYAYYVAEDGAVYELDLDSSRGAVVETSVSRIREVYERAVETQPELADLLDVAIVDRADPQASYLQSFRVLPFYDPDKESIEVAHVRHAAYFADRIEQPGPAYVYQRMPQVPFDWVVLQLVGDVGFDVEVVLELYFQRKSRVVVEVLCRGTRSEIVAFLRRPEIGMLVSGLVAAIG